MQEQPLSTNPVAIAIGRLFKFYGRQLNLDVGQVYARALRRFTPAVIAAAVERAMESRAFLPKPSELRADAEVCYSDLVAAHPHKPCHKCQPNPPWGTPGWAEIVDERGIKSLARCECFTAWQAERRGPVGTDTRNRRGGKATDARTLAEQIRERIRVVDRAGTSATRKTR